MPHPGLLHLETLPLQQATDDLFLLRIYSDTVLTQSLWVGSVTFALLYLMPWHEVQYSDYNIFICVYL